MADDKTKRAPQNEELISLTEDYAVEYWTKKLGVSRGRLVEAVTGVGHLAVNIGAYLEDTSAHG